MHAKSHAGFQSFVRDSLQETLAGSSAAYPVSEIADGLGGLFDVDDILSALEFYEKTGEVQRIRVCDESLWRWTGAAGAVVNAPEAQSMQTDDEEDKLFQAIYSPNHYTEHPSKIQCIEITQHENFCVGNAIKYLWRAGKKRNTDMLMDLRKAAWYVNQEILRLGAETKDHPGG